MNRIKEIRKIYNLNQSELAEKLNTTQQTISNWENGVTDIDLDSLLLISNTFDLSIDYILCKTDKSQLKNEENTIDKPLNNLIKKAQGNRTQNAFALDCGIDSSSLTRILNGENTPKPEILKKISVQAQNNVSYTDLMIAAGFIDINEMKKYFANDYKTNLLEIDLNNSLIVVKNNKIQSYQFSESEIDAILLLLNNYKK